MKRILLIALFLIIVFAFGIYAFNDRASNISRPNLQGEIVMPSQYNGNGIMYINASGGIVKFDAEHDVARPSDNVDILYYCRGEKNYSEDGKKYDCIYKYNRNSKSTELLYSSPQNIKDYACDEDAVYLLDDKQLIRHDLKTGETSTLFENVNSLKKRNNSLCFVTDDLKIYYYDIGSKNVGELPLAPVQKAYDIKLDLSANGDFVAYQYNTESNVIYVQNIHTKAEKKIDLPNVFCFCLSPDGQYIAYKEYSDNALFKHYWYPCRISVYDISTGKSFTLLDDISELVLPFMYWQ